MNITVIIAAAVPATALLFSVLKEVREWLKSRTRLAFHLDYIKSLPKDPRTAAYVEQLQLDITVTNKGPTPITLAALCYSKRTDRSESETRYIHPMHRLGQGEAYTMSLTLSPFPDQITDVYALDATHKRIKGRSRRQMSAFTKRYAQDIAHVRKCVADRQISPRTS